ncbi:S8 family serine peptidase [Cohnella fermenti]|nr:S8 family serine peptidase [Cohnella fermenti]
MKRSAAHILLWAAVLGAVPCAGAEPAASAGPNEAYMTERGNAAVRAAEWTYAQAGAGSPAKPADFLQAIGIPAAWRSLKEDVTGTIAIVDTGVDLNYPGLAKYLTDGANLLDSKKSPEDDNGHGTAVAGVIAQIAEAAGTAGAAWKMKIMPIKALDSNGEGSEASLVRGIQYAIEKRADIVVLSLGLRRDAPEMRKVVEQAEQAGVLLIAAGGNDAAEFGKKAAIQYPAAYPTVLAVGGSDGLTPRAESTPGSEVDLAAPWTVSTYKLDGGTVSVEGTSMGAPQVAGAAALLMAAKPDYSPAQVREMLRRTAQDAASPGWDPQTGYGIVRADLAVAEEGSVDWREPNDSRGTASAFPLGSEVLGTWTTESDWDTYKLDVPYDGELSVRWNLPEGGDSAPNLLLQSSNSSEEIAPLLVGDNLRTWAVRSGRYYLKTNKGKGEANRALAYRLVSSFKMAADAMEPNGTPLQAFSLSPRTQSWTGNFDRQGDLDWVQITLPKTGKLRITVEPSTTRIDPAIYVERAGGESTWTKDTYGSGRSEQLVLTSAAPGKYYIQVRNAVSDDPDPVIGTYNVLLEYITPYVDAHEPNDSPLQATAIRVNSTAAIQGLISSDSDKDYYRFTIDEPMQLGFRLSGVPVPAQASLKLYDKGAVQLGEWSNAAGSSKLGVDRLLQPGTYYVSVQADRPIQDSYYSLTVDGVPAVQSFKDVSGHWAEGAIAAVVKEGWMSGYGEGKFMPDKQMTRAEAIVIAVRVFEPARKAVRSSYRDASSVRWAYDSILRAEAEGWLSGFAGLSLMPDQPITRGEAAQLVANAAGLVQTGLPKLRFLDVPTSHQAAAAIDAVVRKGWMSGYGNGNFRPDQGITRAEWAAVLAKLAKQR